jgi:hypothetical protein
MYCKGDENENEVGKLEIVMCHISEPTFVVTSNDILGIFILAKCRIPRTMAFFYSPI